MELPRYMVVIPAKNSADWIETTIISLWKQTHQPDCIIVVNDGSTDHTQEVAEGFGATVINLPDIGFYATGTPHIAKVINTGIEEALKHFVSYVFISGSDDVFPSNYVQDLMTLAREEGTSICSGYVEGDPYPAVPQGGGRLITREYLEFVGKYKETWGWETHMLVKAQVVGLKIAVYPLPFQSQRSVMRGDTKFYYWGKGMKAIGYTMPYAIARTFLMATKNRKAAMYLLKGFLTKTNKHKDIGHYYGDIQRERIRAYLTNPRLILRRLRGKKVF